MSRLSQLRQLVGRLPWGVLLASIPALALLALAGHYYSDLVSDDAYVSFRYAEHLGTGRGLEWNPEYRVEGYSNFLWVAILGLLRAVGLQVPAAGFWLSWGCAALSVVGIAAAAARGKKPAWELVVLAPLPLVLSFPYQWWTAMRLETAGFGFLLLWAALAFDAEERRGDPRPWRSVVPYLGLALIRPEGAAFVGLAGLYLLARHVRSWSSFVALFRRRWLWAAIWIGCLAVYHGWRFAYFGDIFPNTYYAKVGDGALSEGWSYLTRFVGARPLMAVVFVLGLVMGAPRSRLGLMLVGNATLLATLVVFEGGDWMREWRFFMPALPVTCAALAVAVQQASALGGRAVRVSAVAGAVVLALLVQRVQGTPLDEWKLAWQGNKRDQLINMEGEMVRISRDVAEWIRKNTAHDALVAVNHAGALPFYADRPTLDMAALNDRHIARIPGWVHGKWDPDYVLRRKPELVVLNTNEYPNDFHYSPGYWQGETALVEHPDFYRLYEPVKRIWAWRSLGLTVRNLPHYAQRHYIMVFRRKAARYRKVGRCLGFEDGTFIGWTPTGEAFGNAPVPTPPGKQDPELGKYMAESYRGDDKKTGSLRSDPLLLQGDVMEFLICGGSRPGTTGVRLLVDGKQVLSATGNNDRRPRRRQWDISPYRRKQGVIEIFDHGSGDWEQITADAFCQYVEKKTPKKSSR